MGLDKWLRKAGRHFNADLIAAINRQTDAISFAGLEGRVLRFAYRTHEIRLLLPDGDHDEVQSSILRHRTFYEESILSLLDARYGLRGGTVVDAGANVGNHSVYFTVVSGAARCLAFEPVPYLADTLERNLTLNNIGGVELRRGGLADRNGFLEITRFVPHNLGGTNFGPAEAGIPCWKLDGFALERCDLVKIDVEGAAPHVIVGALETLSTLHPPVVVELSRREYEAGNGLLTRLGYVCRDAFAGRNFIYEWSAPRVATAV